VQDYLIQQLELYQATPAFAEGYRQSFDGYHAQYHDGTAVSAYTGANIIGYLPGTDPAYADEVVLLGAHYDHIGTLSDPYGSCNTHPDMDPDDEICNGAADNASGVATLLEILRCFYEYDLPHPRTLVFAFWDCEEDGLIGSNYYVMEDPVFPLDDTFAYINVDMIGLTLFAGMEDGVFATSYDTAAEWDELMQSYDNKITGGVALIPVSYNLSMGASDHYNFSLGGPLLGKKAIPSIFFTSSTADGYHTVIDDMELVNINHVMLVSRIIMVMSYDVAHSNDDWVFTGDLETMKLTAIPQESDIPGLIMQIGRAHV
jgi:Zn-dependent M28 family amino/carboxypeptidase